jgi:hypothetical protein
MGALASRRRDADFGNSGGDGMRQSSRFLSKNFNAKTQSREAL